MLKTKVKHRTVNRRGGQERRSQVENAEQEQFGKKPKVVTGASISLT